MPDILWLVLWYFWRVIILDWLFHFGNFRTPLVERCITIVSVITDVKSFFQTQLGNRIIFCVDSLWHCCLVWSKNAMQTCFTATQSTSMLGNVILNPGFYYFRLSLMSQPTYHKSFQEQCILKTTIYLFTYKNNRIKVYTWQLSQPRLPRELLRQSLYPVVHGTVLTIFHLILSWSCNSFQ